MSKVKVLTPFAHSTVFLMLINRSIIFPLLTRETLTLSWPLFPSSQIPLALSSNHYLPLSTAATLFSKAPFLKRHAALSVCSCTVTAETLYPTILSFLSWCFPARVSASHACPVPSEGRRWHQPLQLQLWTTRSLHVGAGDPLWVLWRARALNHGVIFPSSHPTVFHTTPLSIRSSSRQAHFPFLLTFSSVLTQFSGKPDSISNMTRTILPPSVDTC